MVINMSLQSKPSNDDDRRKEYIENKEGKRK
jgi:hypothetical protein